MSLRVLTWNLKHGRAVPSAGRELLGEFTAALAGWDWDVALLQEVPPWWPPELGQQLGADQRLVLTSRNALLGLRRAVAVRWPDVIKSNGGGANAILVRGPAVVEHRVKRLGWWPEPRWLHAVRLETGVWAGNLHTQADERQGQLAARVLLSWAAGSQAVLGGDFNVWDLELDGFIRVGGHASDQVFLAGGLSAAGEARVLERGSLSDHAPVLVTVVDLPS